MTQRPVPTRVLVVEDEVDSRRLAHYLIEAMTDRCGQGWEVAEAADVDLACQLLCESRFDCILLDLGMPRYSPQEVVRRIQACSGDMSILVMTNNVDDSVYEFCQRAGVSGFLPKMACTDSKGLKQAICEAMEWQETQVEHEALSHNALNYFEVERRYSKLESEC